MLSNFAPKVRSDLRSLPRANRSYSPTRFEFTRPPVARELTRHFRTLEVRFMFAGARRLLAAVTFGVISVQSIQAQVATGRVTGRVLETASQGPLANVSVTVVGSTLGTYTRPDGGYTLAAVPAGSVKLRVA